MKSRYQSDWEHSKIAPIYKNKDDLLERGNNHGIKLMEHAMKWTEKIAEERLRKQVLINENDAVLVCVRKRNN